MSITRCYEEDLYRAYYSLRIVIYSTGKRTSSVAVVSASSDELQRCTRDRGEQADAPSATLRRRGRRSDWRCPPLFRGAFTFPGSMHLCARVNGSVLLPRPAGQCVRVEMHISDPCVRGFVLLHAIYLRVNDWWVSPSRCESALSFHNLDLDNLATSRSFDRYSYSAQREPSIKNRLL